MIDLTTPNEWQYRDESLGGILFPWYTKSFLDELVTWDLSDKVVFEYGAGASTLWWARKCRKIYSVESNAEYYHAVHQALVNEPTSYPDSLCLHWLPEAKHYIDFIKDWGKYDIVIIDGEPIAWRDDCVKPALDCLKPGSRLIIDNWDQPSVGWLPSEETKALLAPYPCKVYPQIGHPDWKTLLVTVP